MTARGPRANSDAIIRSARRRARANAARARKAEDVAPEEPTTVATGNLAVDPEPVEIESPEPEPKPQRQPRPRRQAVPAPDLTALPRPAFVAGLLSLIVVAIVGLLLLNTTINSDSFHLQELRDDKVEMTRTEQALEDDLSRLNTLNNLEAAAERLGMEEPDTVTYLDLETGETYEIPRNGN
ncbi:hypothetical protein [Haloglycomyces albus]|uniref:hypothetical protein n=1 Tax=Haloglycomyces albus TaxID=526067 RepID=UPI00046D7487|nr:hypothetical protein [Haloglycomyces albus]